jgi:hypothetical protein
VINWQSADTESIMDEKPSTACIMMHTHARAGKLPGRTDCGLLSGMHKRNLTGEQQLEWPCETVNQISSDPIVWETACIAFSVSEERT